MKYAMCSLHINVYFSKYIVFNGSKFILIHCDFTYNIFYDITSADVIFSVLSDVKINVTCL